MWYATGESGWFGIPKRWGKGMQLVGWLVIAIGYGRDLLACCWRAAGRDELFQATKQVE